MAMTQTDLDNLNNAIASGARVVEFRDQKVEYRSLAEMIKAKNLIEQELSGKTISNSHVPTFSKGFL